MIGQLQRAYCIDMARYQIWFDPAKAEPGLIDIAIIKATDGISYIDPLFETFYPSTLELTGNGAYHYLRSAYSGKSQAAFFTSVTSIKDFDILAIDFERTYNVVDDNFVKVLYECLLETSKLNPTKKVLLYTNSDIYNTVIYPAAIRIWGRDVFTEWGFWVAQYYGNPDGEPDMPTKRKDWVLWQFSDRGDSIIHGTGNRVDRDVFNGTVNDYVQWIGNSTPPPTGETMVEDKFLKVTIASLNIRSSAENLGSTNDLGTFNLTTNDIVHVVEVVVNGVSTYHRIDKIWRNGSVLPFQPSPTGNYWAVEKESTYIYMVETINPEPTPTEDVWELFQNGILKYRITGTTEIL